MAAREILSSIEFLKGSAVPEVDLSACTHLHTALLQLLLAARPKLASPPADPMIARWVGPLLADKGEHAGA